MYAMAGGPGTLTDGGSGSQTTTVFDQFDLTKKENFSAYLNAVQNKAQAGEVLDAQDVTTAKALLYHYFGYPMGALKSDPSSDAAVRDQLRADLSETITKPFQSALSSFSRSDGAEQQARYDFYSNIRVVYSSAGMPTNERTIDFVA
jgi:hypothetical protein